ncbi:MAG: hypothetical protein JWQ34_637 [Mucilaginibacter sp.]|uniref:outer membrane beta-barrel protein n=1 Tax=Mucilaginibacter sp. TaxID=1882438 RepID=UPI00260DF4E7|nr:outer membrane beta-barrel protein [Mucilaginibacter sp.]MDB5002412.1 hypothetical protein [Mucilaginibacter sp.]
MKNESNFLNEIEDTLHAYEDAYVPGAWEVFQQKRKRRRMAMLFFRVGAAAAVLLLVGYGAMQLFAKQDASMQLMQTKNKIHQPFVKPLKSGDENITAGNTIGIDKGVMHNYRDTIRPMQTWTKHNTAKSIQNLARYAPANQPATYKDSTTLIVNNKAVKPNNAFKVGEKLAVAIDTARPVKTAAGVVPGSVFANNETEKHKADNKPVYDLLVKSKTNQQLSPVKTKTKSVTYAVIVSPALGNQKVNFGTGVQVSYHFNNNLSISSGLAYSSLNATSAGNPGTDPHKKVQQVDLALSGFEVPIGLQYKTNNGFYVSAGVVGMSVLNNHLSYNYLTESTITAAASTNASGTGPSLQYLSVVTQQKTEESKEKINNYMGFYILSIGKKKAVGRNQINFGPFLRVPFGAVSSEKINLMQGGIHLGFEF